MFFTEDFGKVGAAKKNIFSVIYRLIYQKHIFCYYFSLKNVKKSMICIRIKVRLLYQLVLPNACLNEVEEIHSAKMF